MSKKVISVAMSDREVFKVPTKKEAKKIADRVRKRCRRKGLEGIQLERCIDEEIRHELFELLAGSQPRNIKDERQPDESDFFDAAMEERDQIDPNILRIWGVEEKREKRETNRINLERETQRQLDQSFNRKFCPVCGCCPCVCREEE